MTEPRTYLGWRIAKLERWYYAWLGPQGADGVVRARSIEALRKKIDNFDPLLWSELMRQCERRRKRKDKTGWSRTIAGRRLPDGTVEEVEIR